MKIKITVIYLLAFVIMFMCSCSQAEDTPARVLRSNTWTEKGNNDVNLHLSFKNDNAVIKITDEKGSENIITGTTIISDKDIKVTDKSTLTEYDFHYWLTGENVKISYNDKTIKLFKE